MPLAIAVLLLQLACVVHAVMTRRDRMWIYVLILMPGLGTIAYAIAELVPELVGDALATRRGRTAVDAVRHRLNPDKDLKALRAALAAADTLENRRRLAEELIWREEHDEAAELLRPRIAGLHAEDPDLLHALARAELGLGHAAQALALLHRVRAAQADYRVMEINLLEARALERLGHADEAIEAYRGFADGFPGEEARARLTVLLLRAGRRQEAEAVFRAMLGRAERAGRRYGEDQRVWLDVAREQLRAGHVRDAQMSA